MLEDIAELSRLQNDQINKFQKAVDWEQGFVAALADRRHDSWKAKGQAVWLFADDPRQAMQFMQPPVTSTNQLRAWQIYLSMINSMAGTGTIAEGQPGRNMPRAGAAMNNLISLGLADVQDLAELAEQEVLTPGLSDIYAVSRDFIPQDQLLKIPGAKGSYGSILKPSDIFGEYEFEWIGSLQFQETAQRSQQLLVFLNMFPAIAPYLQQQGYAPDMVALVRMIWRYGLGERGLSDILVKMNELVQKVQTEQGGDGSSTDSARQVPGMKYNLPSPTNGFVQQS